MLYYAVQQIIIGVTCPHLGSGLTSSLGLGSHGSLQLMRQLHVFDLHALHLDAPVVRSFIQVGLETTGGRGTCDS